MGMPADQWTIRSNQKLPYLQVDGNRSGERWRFCQRDTQETGLAGNEIGNRSKEQDGHRAGYHLFLHEDLCRDGLLFLNFDRRVLGVATAFHFLGTSAATLAFFLLPVEGEILEQLAAVVE